MELFKARISTCALFKSQCSTLCLRKHNISLATKSIILQIKIPQFRDSRYSSGWTFKSTENAKVISLICIIQYESEYAVAYQYSKFNYEWCALVYLSS